MLMAAGLGTRLRPFTEREPKALLPVLGIPMAQFAIDTLVEAGVTRIVANIHHHSEKARVGLGKLDRGSSELVISDESRELLGSGGGIRQALPHFGTDPFFLLNSDVLCDVDLGALGRAHRRLRDRWGVKVTLTVFPRPRGSGAYREIRFDADRGLVTGLGEVAPGKPFFVGAAVVEPEALAGVPAEGPSEFVPTILLPAIEAGMAGVHLTDGIWHDVGSPALWHETHLALIRAQETSGLPRRWRRRVEAMNHRIAQQCWISRSSPHPRHAVGWTGPCYWSSDGDDTAQCPRSFGPRSVLYGPSEETDLTGGIGMHGIWVKL